MEPPPYDPTVRCLGRVLSDAEVDEHWCDRAILYRALASRSPDLAWAVLDGDRWRVMRLREINDNGLVIFVFGGQISHGEWLVSIWEKAWPMLGFRVNRGDGWLKRMMREVFRLKIRQPLVHFSSYDKVSTRLAMSSPQYDPKKRMSRHERLYVFTEDDELRRALSWQPAEVREVFPGVGLKLSFKFGCDDTFLMRDIYRFRVIHAIPTSVVNRSNMWRMTVMFYAMRLNFVERGVRDPRRFEFVRPLEIVRWNPFYYIGAQLCCKIARLLDCCDDNGLLLQAYRTP